MPWPGSRIAPVDLDHPVVALAARGALAARLVVVELQSTGSVAQTTQSWSRRRSASAVVPSIEPAAADALEVQRHVEVLGGEQRGGRAARGPELQLVPGLHAAGQLEQLAQRDAQRSTRTGPGRDAAGQRVDHRPGRLLGAHRLRTSRRRRSTMDGTLAMVLDVVDHGRAGVQAVRRPGTAGAAAAGRGSPRASRAAPSPRRRCTRRRRCARRGRGRSRCRGCSCRGSPAAYASCDRVAQPAGGVHHLAADVDEGAVGPDRVGGDDDALDQRVRVVAIISGMSLQVPGSPSSALTTR